MGNERKYFGTDGVRGVANRYPIIPEVALKMGKAAGRFFAGAGKKPRIIIGKDTRISGYMLESALMSGICSMGGDVYLVGPMPTPGISFVTRSMRANAGIVISASHNPYQDNGIKFFGPQGHKLPEEDEISLEMLMEEDTQDLPDGINIGKAFRIDDAEGRYIVYAKSTFPKGMLLDGMKIVVDCANGAGYRVGPDILEELGANVIKVGCTPDGININDSCGSTDTRQMQDTVVKSGADIGIALDGDADRVIMADGSGNIVDGDDILLICAERMKSCGLLRSNKVVGTIMTNVGMEYALRERGIDLVRTSVGDRYVMEAMTETGAVIGGEPSGHIIFLDHSTTGDGIISALQILAAMVETGKTLNELRSSWNRYPQVMRNLRVTERVSLEGKDWFEAAMVGARESMGKDHLLSVRYSGTEPLLRITVSCESKEITDSVIEMLSGEIEKRLGIKDNS